MGRAAFIAMPPASWGGSRTLASGCRLADADGGERLDFDMAGGAALLGHADPEVEASVAEGWPCEQAAAGALADLLPGSPAVRFTAEEAQALPAAIDAARRATGRRRAAVWESGAGVHGGAGDAAAVVVDPLGADPADLVRARLDADAAGAVLIFDEGVSGFRVHEHGAQGLCGVVPDLSVHGAQIANGRPIGAICGRADLIGELSDEDMVAPRADSLAAAAATLARLGRAPVAPRIGVLGAEIIAEVGRLADAAAVSPAFAMAGDPALPTPFFGAPWFEGLWLREMAARGLNVVGPHALCAAHGEPEVARLVAAYARILPMIADEARKRRAEDRRLLVFEACPEGLS